MANIPQPTLFSWKEVENLSEMKRLRMVLHEMPDEDLMLKLEADRGNGRDDYPIRAVWNSLLAGIVFQHSTVESLRRELGRNAQLCWVCGFDLGRGDKMVPPAWVYTRFLAKLLKFSEEVEEMFDVLVKQITSELPDFGETLAVDGKAIKSHARGKSKTEERDGRREVDADWGIKQYTVNNADGSVAREVKRWFGFKVHTVADAKYELPVSFEVTKASASEYPEAHRMLDNMEERQPLLLESCEHFVADRGYDDGKLHARLWDNHGIKPVIGIRNLWKKPEGMDATRGVKSLYNVAYDFEGNIYCYNVHGHKHKMAHGGFEKDRNTIKYRCPAKHYGCTCYGKGQCEIKTAVRIPITEDRRVFGPVARDSYKWNDIYKKRTAIERVYSRLDTSFGFENHTIRGLKKMKLRVGLAYMGMLAMALARIKENQQGKMRSLVKAAA